RSWAMARRVPAGRGPWRVAPPPPSPHPQARARRGGGARGRSSGDLGQRFNQRRGRSLDLLDGLAGRGGQLLDLCPRSLVVAQIAPEAALHALGVVVGREPAHLGSPSVSVRLVSAAAR